MNSNNPKTNTMKKYTIQFATTPRVTAFRAFAVVILATALLAANTATGQTVTQDEHGNLHAKPREVALRDSTTRQTFTDSKGQVHPVYKGAKGSLYYGVTSKKGSYYRRYLKVEG